MQGKNALTGWLTAALLLACVLQACNGCNNRNRPGAGDSTVVNIPGEAPADEDTVRILAEQRLIQWKGWVDSTLAQKFSMDSLEKTVTDTLPRLNVTVMEDSLFNDFKPYFVYSPDSLQVVDMVSYGNFLHKGSNGKTVLEYGEPDTEVAIVNVRTKQRERILFTGPSTVIKEAMWINAHTVLVAGGTYDENDQLRPVVWKYDTATRQLDSYE